MEYAVKMEHIYKSFSGVKVLQDVSFELEKGEIHALMGANGAGKSTLIKILSGAHPMDQGTLTVDGQIVDIHSPSDAKECGIQCIYQELSLAPDLSIANNIFLGQEKRKGVVLNQKAIDQTAAKMMEDLGIQTDVHTPVSQVGIGEKFFTEICRCLVGNAKIVILDEPTSAMTPNEYRHFLKAIQILKQRGISIIYISHHLDEIFEICDRVTVLRDGRNIATSKIGDITMADLIRQMLGKDVISGKRMVQERDFSKAPVVLETLHLSTSKLYDISFQLHKGEILGITGLLGAGKTELANALFGEDRVLSGKILVDGKDRAFKHPGEAMAAGLALVVEDRKSKGLFQEFSIQQNISISSLPSMSKRFSVVDCRAERAVGEEWSEKIHVKCTGVSQLVRYLSGGNQQKVVLAKWLLRSPKVLILDEPTRGIDIGSKDEIYSMIADLSEAGMSILLLSSEMPEIISLSHRILVMKSGHLVGELPGKGTTQNEILLIAAGE